MTGPDFSSRGSDIGCALRAAVDAGLQSFGDRPAYHKLGAKTQIERSLTGRELRELAIGLARDLNQLPSSPSRVAIVTPAGPEFLVGILACIYAGVECVAPPFPTPGPAEKRFLHVIETCYPDCVVTTHADLGSMRNRLDGMGRPLIATIPIPLDTGCLDADSVLRHLPEKQCSILQHTSGTSGAARAVVVSGANVVANTKLTAESWGFSASDRMLTWLPHHHDMGLFGCLLLPMLVGFPVYQMSPFTFLKRPSRWMEALSQTRATVTGGPAFAMRLARNAHDLIDDLDLRHARAVFCGSEPIPPNLLKEFADHFAPAGLSSKATFACYGLAESTLYVAGRPNTAPIPSCQLFEDGLHLVRIVDPETSMPLQDGQEGEVWVAGPSVPTHYLNAPEESAATFKAKLIGDASPERTWLRTGDLGVIQDGSLNVSGRIKDMIIANGANVPAAEIEWTAAQTDPIFENMAATVFTYGKLEDGKAALVVEGEKRAIADLDTDKTSKAIRAAVLSAHGVDLDTITIVRRGALPRTTSGKVRRGAVKQMFLDGGLTPAVPKAKGAQPAL